MAEPETRYKSNLMRRLVADMDGLDGIFADLAAHHAPDEETMRHPERPRFDAPRRR
ncbi:MAG: hypothetical protein KY455_11740 [Euryarchaeota archaeon]|nr:hypothetical protein [Euryarchaeota archaeon]